jgi:hypothetical protein
VTYRFWKYAWCPFVVSVVLVGCAAANLSWQSYVRSPLHDMHLSCDVTAGNAGRAEPAAPTQILMKIPGVCQPEFAGQHDPRISDATRVIGIVVNGQAEAFAVDALSMPLGQLFDRNLARRHVVNQLIDDVAVSVVYCDTSRCVRVFSQPQQSRPLELSVGGLCNGRMLLVYDGKQYYQNSQKIPLPDADYELTTWSNWKTRHPDSQIYLGE